MRVPWTARRSNQPILKEVSPEYSLEGPMLKLQYFGHLIQRTDSFEKTLMLGKIGDRRRRRRQRMEMAQWHHRLNGHKSEYQRTDTLNRWRRLLRVPWTARKSNQSILQEINPEYSLERLMLKLKLQYFDNLMQRDDLLGKKDPDAGKD